MYTPHTNVYSALNSNAWLAQHIIIIVFWGFYKRNVSFSSIVFGADLFLGSGKGLLVTVYVYTHGYAEIYALYTCTKGDRQGYIDGHTHAHTHKHTMTCQLLWWCWSWLESCNVFTWIRSINVFICACMCVHLCVCVHVCPSIQWIILRLVFVLLLQVGHIVIVICWLYRFGLNANKLWFITHKITFCCLVCSVSLFSKIENK